MTQPCRVAEQLASLLRRGTGFELPIVEDTRPGDISLELAETFDGGPEAYALTVTEDGVRLTASTHAGLFNGVQTLRQLFPASIEGGPKPSADGTWVIPAVDIADAPRFAYRGLMLDVARNFFTVEEVKEQIDVMTQFKLNALHLHLTDDQAWRIEIHEPDHNPSGLPYANLTAMGGQGAVEVPTAVPARGARVSTRSRISRTSRPTPPARTCWWCRRSTFPGHVNAALAAIPQLNPDGQAKPMSTTAEVGWSTSERGPARHVRVRPRGPRPARRHHGTARTFTSAATKPMSPDMTTTWPWSSSSFGSPPKPAKLWWAGTSSPPSSFRKVP